MDAGLLKRFTEASRKRRYLNRSQALSDLIRESLVREEWHGDEEIVGTVSLVYDHHRHDLTERLNHLQHDHVGMVLATLHIHLDHDNCLEVITVRGKASQVQRVADALVGTRGVKHGKLTATTTGKKLR
jgi:CopG family nickel-responsive transcriptional regulator